VLEYKSITLNPIFNLHYKNILFYSNTPSQDGIDVNDAQFTTKNGKTLSRQSFSEDTAHIHGYMCLTK